MDTACPTAGRPAARSTVRRSHRAREDVELGGVPGRGAGLERPGPEPRLCRRGGQHRLSGARPDPCSHGLLGQVPRARLGLDLRLGRVHRVRRTAEHAQPGQRRGDDGQQRGHRRAVSVPADRRLGLRLSGATDHRPVGRRRRKVATIDGAGLSAIQLDTYSAVAADLVPRMQASVSGLDEQTAAAFALFEGWDFHTDEDSAAAAYFNAFWRTCRTRCSTTSWAPDAGRTAAIGGGTWPACSGTGRTTRGGTTRRPRPGSPRTRRSPRRPDCCRRRADRPVRRDTGRVVLGPDAHPRGGGEPVRRVGGQADGVDLQPGPG